MVDFEDEDLSGSTFRQVRLTGSRFDRVDLNGIAVRDADVCDASFRGTAFRHVTMRGVELEDVDISGEIAGLRINGVDVGPLVQAELERRHPDLARMRPTDPEGFRQAWDLLEELWSGTVARARRLPPERLHESVDGEWSFTQTLRHLVYATDTWVGRVLLGNPRPWHPLSLPFDEAPPHPEVPWDREARPGLDEVLAVRADRQRMVHDVLAALTAERLADDTEPVAGPGWPPADSYPVAEALSVVLNEEWWHRQFAERDLAVLESERGT